MTQRQLPSQICLQSLSAWQWTVLQDKCTISTNCKPIILCYSPICQKQSVNKGTVFFSDIPHAMYICTYCCWFKPLDYSLKTQMQGSTMTIICPDKATSTVPLQQLFHILRLSPACSATLNYFHLPPQYEDQYMVMNVSADNANINAINISNPDFRIWQHLSRNCTQAHLQKLTNVPKVPVTQLYRDMINASEPVYSHTIKDDDEDSSLIWTILKLTGIYIGTIGMVLLYV